MSNSNGNTSNEIVDTNRTTNNDRQLHDDQDDDDSECWDDAKALLTNEEDEIDIAAQHTHRGMDLTDGLARKSHSNPTSNFHPASSSLSTSAKASVSGQTYSGPIDDLNILHRALIEKDTEKALAILNDKRLVKELANKKDKHGNTALHLACMLGYPKEVISALLNNKWSIDMKNLQRWTPFHEACSYGNRDVILLMAKQLKDDVDDAFHNAKLSQFLEKTKDYRLVLKWEFQSWVPFVSRVLPSDVCSINKQGKCLRIDTRLLEFEGMFRKRGDSFLIYSNNKWVIVNNKTKKYQNLETPTVYKDIDDKVDEFMSMDIIDLELKSSEMLLTRSTSGWIWKADKVGKVGRFNAALYDLANVYLVTRKRREHLSEEDLKRNKQAYKSVVNVFKFGEKSSQPEAREAGAGEDNQDDDDENEETESVIHRQSLPPPPSTNVSWEDYVKSDAGDFPNLGREQKCKVTKTSVRASVAVSEEFPLSKRELLELLALTPIKMFKKLKEFVEMKLPDGFPVRLDIPIFPFLTARITFEDFTYHNEPINESFFSIPHDYELDSNLLPGNFRGHTNTTNPETSKEM